MGRGAGMIAAPEPTAALSSGGGGVDREHYWRSFDNSVTAVSFGFVATAILISMFLIMAVFEKFLRPRSPAASGGDAGLRKLDCPSPKMSVYPKGVSVLMPGETIPTFLAHLAPAEAPSTPERAPNSSQ